MDKGIIELFDFTEGEVSMKRFFESYLETRNEIKSLLSLGLTFVDLANWKHKTTKYGEYKRAIDDYFVTEIEDAVHSRAMDGDFKSAEMILKNRSSNYNSKLIVEVDGEEETEALIHAVLEGLSEDYK